jgi:hypothetical protein
MQQFVSGLSRRMFLNSTSRLTFSALIGVIAIQSTGVEILSPAQAAVSTKPANELAGVLTEWLPNARPGASASLTWLGLKVYDAHVWTGPSGVDPAQWKSQPFALELHYLRALKGKLIAERSLTEIEKLGIGSAAQRTEWLEAMMRIFPDVNKHDRLVGVHRPGKGIVFLHNEKVIGKVDDALFGDAFFAIWFDAKTSAPAVRQTLFAGLKSTKSAAQ